MLAQAPRAHPVDLALAVPAVENETYKWSPLMIARASRAGTLELLSAAWEQALGYGRQELAGMTLRQLMRAGAAVATRTVAQILDEDDPDAVELTLFTRSNEAKRLKLHRRYDAYIGTIFIVAEEHPAAARRWSGMASGPPLPNY